MSTIIPASRRVTSARLPALDGVRGLLAFFVAFAHYEHSCGNNAFIPAARIAVIGFFLLSSYVLTVAWDGNFVTFLGKRFAAMAHLRCCYRLGDISFRRLNMVVRFLLVSIRPFCVYGRVVALHRSLCQSSHAAHPGLRPNAGHCFIVLSVPNCGGQKHWNCFLWGLFYHRQFCCTLSS